MIVRGKLLAGMRAKNAKFRYALQFQFDGTSWDSILRLDSRYQSLLGAANTWEASSSWEYLLISTSWLCYWR